jgi:hypothetical protein
MVHVRLRAASECEGGAHIDEAAEERAAAVGALASEQRLHRGAALRFEGAACVRACDVV